MLEQWHTQQGQLLDPTSHDELIDHWRPKFEACSGDRVPDAPDLLIGARLDAASGIERAWESAYSWFTDPQIFSSEWIDNVNALTASLDMESRML